LAILPVVAKNEDRAVLGVVGVQQLLADPRCRLDLTGGHPAVAGVAIEKSFVESDRVDRGPALEQQR